MRPVRSVRILGVRVDAVTMDEVVAFVLECVRSRRQAGRTGPPAVVVTPNPEIVVAARQDPELAAFLERADLAVPDGIGLIWAARRAGTPLPERVTGVDLLERVLAVGAGEGLRVFFLGARPGVAEEAARRSVALYPGLVVAGTQHGYFPSGEELAVARRVAESRAEFLVVGMGSPRQEKWLAAAGETLGRDGRVAVALPVGGALDVLSGRVARAPQWAVRSGLEWLARLVSQPARWRRAPALARFVLGVLAEGPVARSLE